MTHIGCWEVITIFDNTEAKMHKWDAYATEFTFSGGQLLLETATPTPPQKNLCSFSR